MAFVSKERRIVFVHIPKTGGTSISVALADAHGAQVTGNRSRLKDRGIGGAVPGEYRPNGISVHDTLQEIRQKFAPAKNYQSFCVVRNPWARIFSYYQHKRRINDPQLPPGTFAEVFRTSNFLLLQPQTFWMRGKSGALDIDHVLRMESLEADFNALMEDFDISARLPHLNRSDEKPYQDHYDDYSKQLILEYYHHEIERFGYKF